MPSLRILVALNDLDSEALVREVVHGSEEFEVVGYAREGPDAVQQAAATTPDVVLVAADLGGTNGYEAAGKIALRAPRSASGYPVCIVMVGPKSDVDDYERAMASGAAYIIAPPLARENLSSILQAIAKRTEGRSGSLGGEVPGADARTTVAVCGSRRGAGKTLIAVNLAAWLARHEPNGVVLADVSPQFGDVAAMLDTRPRLTLADLATSTELDMSLIRQAVVRHASSVDLLIGSWTPQPLDLFDETFAERLLACLRRAYRYTILDVPSLLQPGALSILSRADYVLVVCGACEISSPISTRRYVDALRDGYVAGDRIHVILNQTARVPTLDVKQIEHALGRPVVDLVPNDERRVLASVNAGQPIVLSSPSSPVSLAVGRIGQKIREGVHEW